MSDPLNHLESIWYHSEPLDALQSRTEPVQGQNRVFPVYLSHTGKYLFSWQGSQMMRTGFSLWEKVHRENPVFITGIPANVNRFFPVWEKYTGKTLFWPCAGPVRDCSVFNEIRENCIISTSKCPFCKMIKANFMQRTLLLRGLVPN